jgi:hypothetical protein
MSNYKGESIMKRILVGLLSATFVALFLGGALSACKPSEKVATRIAFQYSVGKYIEQQTPAARVEKAREILLAVETLSTLAGSDATTVDALRAYVAQRMSHMSPADRFALGAIIDLGSEILKERVGDGVLKPGDAVIVRDVLSWVSEAASAYVPPTS